MTRDWTIEIYRPRQFEAARQMLSRAFFNDPSSVYILPEPGRRGKHLPWLFGMMLRYGSRHGEVYIIGEPGQGLVSGAAVWLPSERAAISFISQIRLGMWQSPFKLGPGTLRRVLNYSDYLDFLRKRILKERLLWLLAVDPVVQGTGRGTALLNAGLGKADTLGERCYLETHQERNLRFYGRHGFAVVLEGEVPRGGPRVWCMERTSKIEKQ